MPIIYEVPKPQPVVYHYCEPKPPAKDYGVGTVWQCDVCGRRWQRSVERDEQGTAPCWRRRHLPWPPTNWPWETIWCAVIVVWLVVAVTGLSQGW